MQVENHVYENTQLSPLTILFYLVVVDENIVLELQTLNSYTLFWAYTTFHKQALPSTYICTQNKNRKVHSWTADMETKK